MNELLWYASRAAGLVSLLLLTSTLVLGILTAGRTAPLKARPFVLTALHRSLSLIMVVGVAVHVITAVVETYVNIGWISAVIPFTSSYDRFWVGLGTVAVDLLLIITVTSLLRQRIGQRWWRLVHWSAYALWPITLAHTLGAVTTDGSVAMIICAASAISVGAALIVRTTRQHPDTRRRRLTANLGWRS